MNDIASHNNAYLGQDSDNTLEVHYLHIRVEGK
jgi:hypothetical protein